MTVATQNIVRRVAVSAVILVAAQLFAAGGFLPAINGLLLVPFAVCLAVLAQIDKNKRWILAMVLTATAMLGLFIAVYRPEGFFYPLVWQTDSLYVGGKPFALTVNISKALCGYLILAWLLKDLLNGLLKGAHRLPATASMQRFFAVVTVAIAAILGVANVLFDIKFEPKFPHGLGYFSVVNLLLTVVAEEAFFRLLLQRHISRLFVNVQRGQIVSVVVVSLLFAVVHGGMLSPVTILFLWAGFTYALVYAKTNSFIASVLVHFGVNILHFTLFEYPVF